MVDPESASLRIRCRDCGRTVLTGVSRIGDAEVAALGAHFDVCRPDLDDPPRDAASASLATLLSRFDVQRA